LYVGVDWIEVVHYKSTGGSCEHGKAFMGCRKGWELPNELRVYKFL
jgi:hypothetical protein